MHPLLSSLPLPTKLSLGLLSSHLLPRAAETPQCSEESWQSARWWWLEGQGLTWTEGPLRRHCPVSPPPCSVQAKVQAHWLGGGRWETYFTLVFLGHQPAVKACPLPLPLPSPSATATQMAPGREHPGDPAAGCPKGSEFYVEPFPGIF